MSSPPPQRPGRQVPQPEAALSVGHGPAEGVVRSRPETPRKPVLAPRTQGLHRLALGVQRDLAGDVGPEAAGVLSGDPDQPLVKVHPLATHRHDLPGAGPGLDQDQEGDTRPAVQLLDKLIDLLLTGDRLRAGRAYLDAHPGEVTVQGALLTRPAPGGPEHGQVKVDGPRGVPGQQPAAGPLEVAAGDVVDVGRGQVIGA